MLMSPLQIVIGINDTFVNNFQNRTKVVGSVLIDTSANIHLNMLKIVYDLTRIVRLLLAAANIDRLILAMESKQALGQ